MTDGTEAIEIFLQPGEYYFADSGTRIRTLLGSCVAITMWHPARRLGGMLHAMLPTDQRPGKRSEPDGRYLDEGFELLLREALNEGSDPAEYQYKAFGGADMFAGHGVGAKLRIGDKNAGKALDLLAERNLQLHAQDLGGRRHRSIIFDLASGDVWVGLGKSGATVRSAESVAR